MEKYYTMKEEMLTVFEPSLIHRQYVVGEKKEYLVLKRTMINYCKKSNDIIWKGGYRDENDIEVKFLIIS